MRQTGDFPDARNLDAFVLIASSAAVIIAGLGLAGHLLAIPALYSLHPGYQAMSLLTAAGLMLLGAGVMSRAIAAPRLALLLCTAGGLVAASVLVSYIFTGSDMLDPAIAVAVGADVANIGRTSLGTAIGILGISLSLHPVIARSRRSTEVISAFVFLLALLALVGYAYSSTDLYALPFFHTMALNTAVAILLLALAAVLGRTGDGWGATIAAPGEAGRATRRQLTFLLFPPFVGWALVQMGNAGLLHFGSAMALLVVLSVAPLLWLILRDGRALVALDRERGLRTELEADQRRMLEGRLTEQATELEERSQARLLVAEQAKLKSEGRYRSLFDSIDAGFCVIEMRFDETGAPADYRFLEVNVAFEEYTGLRQAEGSWMRSLAPDHEQHWFDLYGKVAKTQEPVRFDNPAKELGDRWYEVHAFPLDDPALCRVGILFNDITGRKRAEEELRQINATLEERVATEVAEREYAQAALRQSQKMEALGQLTGGVAHDFNNLLTPIVGSLDMLSRRGSVTDRERRLLDGAVQSADRAKTLVQRLLAFARRQPLQPGPVDIRSLIAGMGELVGSTTGPQVRVVVDTQSDLPPARADAHQLEMAILNLCVNARDAMPDGGTLTIAASAETPPSDGSLGLPAGSYIMLTVADTGTGMDAETVRRSIEPFYSTKGIGKGTGLGLSMVHGLAAQLNGTLDIKSTLGFGTRIDLWLPVSTEHPVIPDDTTGRTPLPTHHGRVLVVDDEPIVRAITADMLRELGYETVEMGNAREAHALLLDDGSFDLVVTDHMMPGMTGGDLALAVRRHRPALPVLLVSGYADAQGIAPDIMRLAKPFRLEDLTAAIDDLVSPGA